MAFHISLQVGEKIYEGKGKDAFEALKNLEKPPKPLSLKTVVTLKRDNKSRTYPLLPARSRRFYQRIALPYVAKQLEILMK